MTKGRFGFEKFLSVLEYNYPHVYRDVVKKEPRDPPAGRFVSSGVLHCFNG